MRYHVTPPRTNRPAVHQFNPIVHPNTPSRQQQVTATPPNPVWISAALGLVDGTDVRVAVIDSGWHGESMECGPSITPGVSFVSRKGAEPADDTIDRHGHGTECIGLAASIAPMASFTPIRIFDRQIVSSVTSLLRALEWCRMQRFDIVSLSLGSDEQSAVPHLYALCEAITASNSIIVASLDPSGRRPYPAVFDNVLSVQNGVFASPYEFTYAHGRKCECHIGPEVVPVQSLGGVPRKRRGASFATPQLVGLLALLRQARPRSGLWEARAFLAEFSRDS